MLNNCNIFSPNGSTKAVQVHVKNPHVALGSHNQSINSHMGQQPFWPVANYGFAGRRGRPWDDLDAYLRVYGQYAGPMYPQPYYAPAYYQPPYHYGPHYYQPHYQHWAPSHCAHNSYAPRHHYAPHHHHAPVHHDDHSYRPFWQDNSHHPLAIDYGDLDNRSNYGNDYSHHPFNYTDNSQQPNHWDPRYYDYRSTPVTNNNIFPWLGLYPIYVHPRPRRPGSP